MLNDKIVVAAMIALTSTATAEYPSTIVSMVATSGDGRPLPATPVPPWLDEVLAQVAALAHLDDDWTSYNLERPSALAIEIALEVVHAEADAGRRPAYVVPSADGGVSMQFTGDERAVLVEISNNGGVALMLHASPESEPDFVDVDRVDVRERLVSFFG